MTKKKKRINVDTSMCRYSMCYIYLSLYSTFAGMYKIQIYSEGKYI